MNTRMLGSMLALAGIALFASLSAWQWQRATWKERLLAAHASALVAAPVPWRVATAAGTPPVAADLPPDAAPPGPTLPLRVALSGSYVPASDLVLDNQRLDGQVGVMVLSLLAPDHGGPAVYVNRGFIPYEGNRRELPALAQIDEPVNLTGLLVAPPAVGVRLGDTAWRPGDVTPQPWIDVEAAAASLGRTTVRAVVLLDAGAAHGFTRRWQALPNTLPPDQHRGYAFQWLALAIAVGVIHLTLTLRRRR